MKPACEIIAPTLLLMGSKLIPCGTEVFPRWSFRLESSDPLIVSAIEPIRSLKSGFHWLVDGNGKLVMFHEMERRPKMPEFLKRIINFTRIYYRMDEPRPITLRELKEITAGKYGSTRKSLTKAIDKHGIDTVLTKQIFLTEIMEEPDPTIELRYELH